MPFRSERTVNQTTKQRAIRHEALKPKVIQPKAIKSSTTQSPTTHKYGNQQGRRAQRILKSRFVLALSITSLVVVVLVNWIPALAITLPMLGILAIGYWLQQQWQKEEHQQQKQQARLDAKFYQLLQQQQGHISVMEFAMQAQINGEAAQAYLNRQAQAFSAYVETRLPGNMIYVFSLAALQGLPSHHAIQAEAAWAYAEQARVEKTKTEQAHAAWVNAKQIRTLHQLSHQGPSPQRNQLKSSRQHDDQETILASAQSSNTDSSNTESPNSIRAGYIAITTIDSHGTENSSPATAANSKDSQGHRVVNLYSGQQHSGQGITIDVPTIGG
ncbi:MAG: hypothetical protein AAGC93_11030 [Cyanobacteria bacterium P01_F01_bin.53]